MAELYSRLKKKNPNYDLTILVLTLPNRTEKLQNLLKELKRQSINKSVQIIYLGDNKSMSVGAKRNLALSTSTGKYVTFIDDDDWVASNYIDKITEAILLNPEVITFNFQKYENGVKKKLCKYYMNAGRPYLSPDKTHYKLAANHLCVWRRDILKEPFPDISLGEDHNWSESMSFHYSAIHNIDEVLYYYYYDTNLSETHKR